MYLSMDEYGGSFGSEWADNLVGGASAATLGFIAGDLPGAVVGYSVYKGYAALRKYMKRKAVSGSKYRKRRRSSYVKKRFSKRKMNKKPWKISFKRGLLSKRTSKGAFVADDLHSGMSMRHYNIVIQKPPKGLMKGGSQQWFEQYGYRSTSSGGLQSGYELCHVGTASQIAVSSGTAISYAANPTQSSWRYLAFNPYEATSGSTIFTATTVPLTDKICLANIEIQIDITNFENLAANVDIYLLRCKQNAVQGPIGSWTQSAQNVQSNSLSSAGTTAAGVATGGVVGYANNVVVGVKPTMFKDWMQLWKIVKVHHINLAAAAHEQVTFNVRYNQVFDMSKVIQAQTAYTATPATWTQANINLPFLKGGLSVLVVQRGCVVDDVTAGATLPTFGTSDIGYVVTKKHVFKPMYGNANRLSGATAYPQISAPTNANMRIINYVDGSSAPVQG